MEYNNSNAPHIFNNAEMELGKLMAQFIGLCLCDNVTEAESVAYQDAHKAIKTAMKKVCWLGHKLGIEL